ncbi:MAG: YgjV family protein [Clostridia bacterium]|nr:YgjV family protein [Clostridia bacterium]MBQ9774308.1 YgjV family protein [Clostridia bacterium]
MDFSEMFSSPRLIAAQCVGALAMVLAFFIYAFRDRKRILLSKMVADLLWVVHYLLLAAYSGAAVNLVNAGREGVFYHKEKKWASSRAWPILFVLLNLVLTVLSWQGPISLLPMLGSSLNALGLWCTSTTRLRMVSLPALTLWLVYSILVGSLWSLLVNGVSILSALYALIRDRVRGE